MSWRKRSGMAWGVRDYVHTLLCLRCYALFCLIMNICDHILYFCSFIPLFTCVPRHKNKMSVILLYCHNGPCFSRCGWSGIYSKRFTVKPFLSIHCTKLEHALSIHTFLFRGKYFPQWFTLPSMHLLQVGSLITSLGRMFRTCLIVIYQMKCKTCIFVLLLLAK